MEDDLGKLQREIWSAVQKAATAGDGNVLSVLGPITGEMKRKYQEWNARFQQLTGSSSQINSNSSLPPSRIASDGAPEEDFTGKVIRGFAFGGEKVIVGTYKEMLVSLAGQLLRKHSDKFDAVVAHVRGQKPYFSILKAELRDPRELKPGLYVETNFPANQVVKVCRELVKAFGYSVTSLRLDVVPFRTRAVKRTAHFHERRKSKVRQNANDLSSIG
ncbi:MAG TPA: hypothetical protein VJX23_06965 [Candidatus Binataceae bacterium]|nr:hypothetical protein [Candidatus Binataceae bacterium]